MALFQVYECEEIMPLFVPPASDPTNLRSFAAELASALKTGGAETLRYVDAVEAALLRVVGLGTPRADIRMLAVLESATAHKINVITTRCMITQPRSGQT
jgi:hypothetical protein